MKAAASTHRQVPKTIAFAPPTMVTRVWYNWFSIQVRRKGSIPQEGEPQEQEPGGSLFATPSGTPPSGTTPTTPSGGKF